MLLRAHSISRVSTCFVTAIFSKRAMFICHVFFIWMTTTMKNCHFQTFYALKVNFNAVLCRESNSIVLFSFGSIILLGDRSQNAMM